MTAPRVSLHQAAVGALVSGNADGPGCLKGRRGKRMLVGCRLYEHRAAPAPIICFADAVPVLDSPVEVEDWLVSPGRLAGFGSVVVPVAAVSARPDHQVDAGPAAEDFAHRERDGAPVKAWVGMRHESPIAFATKV